MESFLRGRTHFAKARPSGAAFCLSQCSTSFRFSFSRSRLCVSVATSFSLFTGTPAQPYVLFAAAPAFSAFAFYRLWIAVVLCSPKTFYRLDAEGKPPDFALEPDDLDRANLRGNLAASVLYLMLGAFPLLYSFIFRR